MEKRRIVVFHPAIAPYRIGFFKSLHSNFRAAFYFNYYNVQDQEFDQTALIRKLGFTPNYLNSGFTFLGRAFRLGIIKRIRETQPDIVLCSEYGQVTICVFLYKFLCRKKFMLYTISDDSIDNAMSRKGIRSFLRGFISKRIDGVIFPSEEVCSWFGKNISSRVKTLELPIIHDDLVFRDDLHQSIPVSIGYIQKYKLEGHKIVLYVGRLVAVKNVEMLINAIVPLKDEGIKLVIVGSGDQENVLHEHVSQLNLQNEVLFTGRKEGSELLAWYHLADLFVLPSTYEPFGAVVNEALLAGSPVICSNLAGAASLITENNGMLFNPYDVSDLSDKISVLLHGLSANRRIELRENLMPFSFDQKIDKLISEL